MTQGDLFVVMGERGKYPKDRPMKWLFHHIVHWLHWQRGYVETWREPCEGGSRLMVGFRCMTCGRVTGSHEAFTQRAHR